MRLKIVQVGEEILRHTARALLPDEIGSPETRNWIEWMRETMRDAPGVGLAAPQVDLPIQLVVIEDRPEYAKDIPAERLVERQREAIPFHVLINPRIVERSAEQAEFFEGCLSLAGFSALVKRPRSLIVEYWDENGNQQRVEAHGWYARILQHEIDHLHGRLYIDQMEPRSFMTLDNMNRRWKELPTSAVRAALGI